jgi:hypothetical protein
MDQGLSQVAIQGIIRRKIGDWLESIDNVELRVFLYDKIIVTGGSIASLLRGDRVNDYDVYFTTREAVTRVAKYYLERFAANPPKRMQQSHLCMYVDDKSDHDRVRIVIQSAGVISADGDDGKYEYFESAPPADAPDYVADVTANVVDDDEQRFANELRDATADAGIPDSDNPELMRLVEQAATDDLPPMATGPGAKAKNRYRPIFLSCNAITLSDDIQIIIRFYGPAEELHKNFDFVHCTNYWQSEMRVGAKLGGTLVVNTPALMSLMSKRLVYIGSRYPLCSLIRTRKFVRRGWTAPAGVFIKAMHQCLTMDWNKIETWSEQLTGVDTAYFHEIIEILKRDKAAGKAIDSAYVVALIDRLI